MASDSDWVVKLTWPGVASALVLTPAGQWRPEGNDTPEMQQVAEIATQLSSPPLYQYHPADGHPGIKIGRKVAAHLHAQFEAAPIPPPEPGVRY